MNALQQFELMDIEEVKSKENFEISDLNSLNWAFRKIAALKQQEKEIKQLADIERERINTWEKESLNPIHNSISFFEGLVQAYHAKQLELDPKKNKTISTPYGKSKSRKSSESIEKQNEERLLEYAIENEMDNFLKVELKWGNLKKTLKIVEVAGEKTVVDSDGQIVPGVSVKPESISYSVEV